MDQRNLALTSRALRLIDVVVGALEVDSFNVMPARGDQERAIV
jgi:hypothetical protein